VNRFVAIVFTVLGLSCAAAAFAIDYPTYKGPSNQRTTYSGGVYSTADQAVYGNQQEQQSQPSFNSTSPYTKQIDPNTYRSVNTMIGEGQYSRQYSVPVSALSVTGGITTEDMEEAKTGVRRVRHRPGGEGETPTDPTSPPDMPVGDTPWLLMLLLAALYAALSFRSGATADVPSSRRRQE